MRLTVAFVKVAADGRVRVPDDVLLRDDHLLLVSHLGYSNGGDRGARSQFRLSDMGRDGRRRSFRAHRDGLLIVEHSLARCRKSIASVGIA